MRGASSPPTAMFHRSGGFFFDLTRILLRRAAGVTDITDNVGPLAHADGQRLRRLRIAPEGPCMGTPSCRHQVVPRGRQTTASALSPGKNMIVTQILTQNDNPARSMATASPPAGLQRWWLWLLLTGGTIFAAGCGICLSGMKTPAYRVPSGYSGTYRDHLERAVLRPWPEVSQPQGHSRADDASPPGVRADK